MTPEPDAARSVTSAPLLRATLAWSGGVAVVLAVVAGIAGFVVSGTDGMWSGLVGVIVATVFLGITGVSILISNRWFGDPLYVPIFFAIVLGGWILKLIIFIVALVILRGQPWVDPTVFFVALVVSVIAALAVDVVTLARMRVPRVNVALPTSADEGEKTD
ncbi:hypothetical protein FHX48_001600 [Microbacterium halimionae]|uniref:ATP synthase protein I n=1 Tax=Microbacterium halimionae TaxID=1526413 RepID=A0A7W3JPA3_9MICO|nr:hypothetical protein [Microbacterium halimionae]MBA8816527.1 hypothetical protein [Microbacterium halimionae]NII95286.1 hypothetical protein [Microbacterium halimionae]